MHKRCRPKQSLPRHRVTLALDGELWDRFEKVLKGHWDGSFTSWVEWAMECYTHDTCDDCPFYDEEEAEWQKGRERIGIGKVIEQQEET